MDRKPAVEDAEDEKAEFAFSQDAADNPFRFEGFYYDSGVKTYDMHARHYRPQIGRFLSRDQYASRRVAERAHVRGGRSARGHDRRREHRVEADGHAAPRRIVEGWMDSPGHRANILRRQFTHAGVGVAFDPPERTTASAAVYTNTFSGRLTRP